MSCRRVLAMLHVRQRPIAADGGNDGLDRLGEGDVWLPALTNSREPERTLDENLRTYRTGVVRFLWYHGNAGQEPATAPTITNGLMPAGRRIRTGHDDAADDERAGRRHSPMTRSIRGAGEKMSQIRYAGSFTTNTRLFGWRPDGAGGSTSKTGEDGDSF